MRRTATMIILTGLLVLLAGTARAQCYNANGVPFPCGTPGYRVPAYPSPNIAPRPSYNYPEPGTLTGRNPWTPQWQQQIPIPQQAPNAGMNGLVPPGTYGNDSN